MSFPNYYLAIGSCENWRSAFAQGNIWGLGEKRRRAWGQLKSGDILFFYPEAPISAVVGYGKILETFPDDKPFFAEDIGVASEWPYRIKFEIQRPSSNPLLGARINLATLDRRITMKRGFQKLAYLEAQTLLEKCRL